MSGQPNSPFEVNEVTQQQLEERLLPINGPPGEHEEFQKYAGYDRDQLRGLSIEDCALIASRLSQYALYLQRSFNRNQSRIRFLEHEIRKTIASQVSDYGGQWEFQKQQAIDNDTYASSTQATLLQYQQINDRLSHVTLSIKDLADRYKDLQFAKINERKADGR